MTRIDRRQFLTSAAGGSLLLSCARKPSFAPPNIVFIMADDLGYGELGCYGQDKIRTPNIDQLAAEGMKFSDAYAGCCVCAPCRSVLMTGLHMGHTSVRSNPGGVPLLPEDETVAEYLRTAGYRNGCFGKWGLGDIGTEGVPWKQGFDEFFGYLHQAHAHYYYPHYLYKNEQQFPLEGNEGDGRGTYSHDVIADQALDFIRANKDNRFFCYVPFTIPHSEYVVPEDSMAEYRGKFPEPEPRGDPRGRLIYQTEPLAALAGMITRMDRDVGRIMDLIKELGLDDNTIVFFVSDNGAAAANWTDYFNSSGGLRGTKGTMYEGGIRVPAMARWPGRIAAGSESGLPWGFWDFLPTALDLAGMESPPHADGVSLVPTLLGEGQQKQREFLYWEYPRYRNGAFLDEVPMQAARSGDWKVVRPEPGGELELYNLAEDPAEANNVAAANAEVMARFEEFLRRARYEPRPQTQPDHIWWERKG